MFEVSGLKLRFQIDKLKSALYGYEGWKILWSCFDMDIFRNFIHYPTFDFFSGDEGNETYCICIEAIAMNPDHEACLNDLAKRISLDREFRELAQTSGIERYNSSVITNSYSPFVKTLSIKNGEVVNTDEYMSPSALKPLKPYIENTRAEIPNKKEKKKEQVIHKPVEEADFNELTRKMLAEGKTDEEILKELEFHKASKDEAKEILYTIYRESGTQAKKKGTKNIIWGLVWTVGGAIATLISISGGSGGYIFWGAIVFGFIQFVQGIIQRISGNRIIIDRLILEMNEKNNLN